MSKFSEKVLQIVKLIPKGKVMSYGQVALMAGVPKAALQVGGVLQKLGDDGETPWWRVINNAGRITIKNPEHGPNEQKKMLENDSVTVDKNLKVDMSIYRYIPSQEQIEKLHLDEKYIELLLTKYLY